MPTKRAKSGGILPLLLPIVAKYDCLVVETWYRKNKREKVLDLLLARVDRRDLTQPPTNRPAAEQVRQALMNYAVDQFGLAHYDYRIEVREHTKEKQAPLPIVREIIDQMMIELKALMPPIVDARFTRPSPSSFQRYAYARVMIRLQVKYQT